MSAIAENETQLDKEKSLQLFPKLSPKKEEYNLTNAPNCQRELQHSAVLSSLASIEGGSESENISFDLSTDKFPTFLLILTNSCRGQAQLANIVLINSVNN